MVGWHILSGISIPSSPMPVISTLVTAVQSCNRKALASSWVISIKLLRPFYQPLQPRLIWVHW